MSLTILIPEARAILANDPGVTALVPASKISFSQRPQGDTLPGIILNMGTVEYEPVFENAAIRTTYRVDFLSYNDSAQSTTAIHEAIKTAVLNYTSSNFHVRLFDESYFVDVDMIHRAQLSVNFYYSPSQ